MPELCQKHNEKYSILLEARTQVFTEQGGENALKEFSSDQKL